MAGYTRFDVTNQIADTNVINAAPLNGEFDAVEAAFNAVSGHRHDGTSAEGAPITVVGPAQDVVVSATVVRPKTDNVIDLGTPALEFKDLWIDGTANIDNLVADAGAVAGSAITTANNTQTLTNKTLTSPVITGGTIDGVAPVTVSGTQTLTNKTINLTSNTLVATSAQLAAALTDETGTGAAVFAGSPTLTGTPTAPTAAAATNTTQIATTAHVFAERTNAATLTNKTLTSPIITGGTIDGVAAATVSGTQTLTNKTINLANNTLVATSAQLAASLTDETGTGLVVFSDSPALTGTPTAPTAVAGTNTTQLATTAHVFAERANTATLTNKTLTSPTIGGTVVFSDSAQARAAMSTPARPIGSTGAGEFITIASAFSGAYSVPAGGTWAVAVNILDNAGFWAGVHSFTGVVAGGTSIWPGVTNQRIVGFGWRIA